MNYYSFSDRGKVVVFITSSAPSLVRFRLPLISKFLSNGYTVVCSAPSFDSEISFTLETLGVSLHSIAYDRRSRNLLPFLIVIWQYYLFFLRVKPEITFAYFLLPILLSTPASFFARVTKRFIYFEGLGSIFTANPFLCLRDKLVVFLLRPLLLLLLRISCVLSTKSFFINAYDCNTILSNRYLSRKAFVTGPIGLDIRAWSCQASHASSHEDSSPPVVLFIGRLINSKGIHQFVKVAEITKLSWPPCRFVVLGSLEYGFDSLPECQLERWVSSGLIEWHGHVPVIDWIKRSTCLLLPTFYREGSPRSIQEAMTMGTPVISSDIPSIRPMINHGETGFLADPFDVKSFSSYVLSLIISPTLRSSVGKASRSYALEHFNADKNAKQLYEAMID